MKNPIPSKFRDVIYLACILIATVVLNAPTVIVAVQTGDWAAAAQSVSGTLMLVGGIVAKQYLTPDESASGKAQEAAGDAESA